MRNLPCDVMQKLIVYAIIGAYPYSNDPNNGLTATRQKELLGLAYDAKLSDGRNVFSAMHGGYKNGDPESKSSWGNNKERRINCLKEHIAGKRILKTNGKRYMLAKDVVAADLGVTQALIDLLAEHTHDPIFKYNVNAARPIPLVDPPCSVVSDLKTILATHEGMTTKETLANARVGQGAFRAQVLAKWDSRCCVTGSTTLAAIRASHIKPWSNSNNFERLDPNNGLPLIGTLDALFDAGLITFTQDGEILISWRLGNREKERLRLSGLHLMRKPNGQTAKYLEYHRNSVFIENSNTV